MKYLEAEWHSLLALRILVVLASTGLKGEAMTTDQIVQRLQQSDEGEKNTREQVAKALQLLASDRPMRLMTNRDYTKWAINSFGVDLMWDWLDKLLAELDSPGQADELSKLQQVVLDVLKKHCPKNDSVHLTLVASFVAWETDQSFSDEEIQQALSQLCDLGLAELKAPNNYAPRNPSE